MPTVAQLEKLLALDPEDTFVLYGLAQEHAKQGDAEASIAFYDRVLAIDPDYLYAYFHKARVLEDEERFPEAIEALETGVERAKNKGDNKALSELQGFYESLKDAQ